MSQTLSSAAVVIGALRANHRFPSESQVHSVSDLIRAIQTGLFSIIG